MSDDIGSIQDLLKEVEKKRAEFDRIKWSSEVRGEKFNVFALCGVDHYETIHSKILAEFLSPKGSHGQKSAYLKLFARALGRAENRDFQDWFSDAAIVNTEVSSRIADVSVGRFDILIEDADQDTVCIIENKIFANEQPEQLERYKKWLDQNRAKHKLLIYLTPDGRRGTTAKDDDYIRFAYLSNVENEYDIIRWLEQCQQWSTGLPFVREAFAQYRNHIINVLKGGLSMKDDVVKLISEKPCVAQLIYENYASMCVNKATALLSDVLGKYHFDGRLDFSRRESGFAIVMDGSGQSLIRIFVGFDGTGLSGFFVGLNKDLRLSPAEVLGRWRAAVRELPVRRGETPFESNDCWPMWKFIAFPDENGSTTWDGRFFEKLEKNEDMKKTFLATISQTIEDIKEVATRFS